MTGIVVSLLFQSSGVTSILLTVGPAITVLMAHFALEDESLTPRKGFGVCLALAGALLLTLRGETGLGEGVSFNPLGYGLVFLAMVSGSGATVYARKYMQRQNSIDVTTIRLIVAACLVAPLSLLVIGFDMSQVDTTGYTALLYAALVGTLAGMYLAFYNIVRFGATAAAVTLYIVPIVSGLIGVLLLGEQITPGILLGMALIFLGVGLINYPRRTPEVI
jgi:drug/metabolite transporter (DMT)-like permease